jgi:PAS domain S-box-containing protein
MANDVLFSRIKLPTFMANWNFLVKQEAWFLWTVKTDRLATGTSVITCDFMEPQMHDDTRDVSSDPSPAQGAESQRELLEQIVRLRTLVDAAFEGIGICRQGIIVDVNEQLTSMLGYERTELIGMPVAKIVASESRDLVRHAIESGRTDAYEHMAIRKDGTVFPVEVRGGCTERERSRFV